jgi:hypothetical protein
MSSSSLQPGDEGGGESEVQKQTAHRLKSCTSSLFDAEPTLSILTATLLPHHTPLYLQQHDDAVVTRHWHTVGGRGVDGHVAEAAAAQQLAQLQLLERDFVLEVTSCCGGGGGR